MTSYRTWTPAYEGHAPPNWEKGMAWSIHRHTGWVIGGGTPTWTQGYQYRVPTEAFKTPKALTPAPNMSLRDYFAGQALPQAMAALGYDDSGEYLSDTIMLKYWVAKSYAIADAMLVERDKTP